MGVKRIFTVGELLVVTAGEYDSYGITGVYKALRDFDIRDEIAGFYDDPEAEAAASSTGRVGSSVAAFLVTRGAIESVLFDEVHVAAYGGLDKYLFCRHDAGSRDEDCGEMGWRRACVTCGEFVCGEFVEGHYRTEEEQEALGIEYYWFAYSLTGVVSVQRKWCPPGRSPEIRSWHVKNVGHVYARSNISEADVLARLEVERQFMESSVDDTTVVHNR
jgi:hypothetical protein